MNCSFLKCKGQNTSTVYVTVDSDYRWFCLDHWKLVSYLFNKLVSGCTRSSKKLRCELNRQADFDKSVLRLNTVKHDGKFFDLCSTHLKVYEELVGI